MKRGRTIFYGCYNVVDLAMKTKALGKRCQSFLFQISKSLLPFAGSRPFFFFKCYAATPVVDFVCINLYKAVAPPNTKWAGPQGHFFQHFARAMA
jgi:hypothetical protein